MITEDYVSFEIAKLLKEKGFSENTICKYADKEGATEEWYDDYRERMVRFKWDCGTLITPPTEPHDKYEVYGDTISAPTLQMAMKWLRETHNFFIGINTVIGSDNIWAQILNIWGYEAFIQKQEVPIPSKLQWDWFPTYEQACEAAIKYCLEKLI